MGPHKFLQCYLTLFYCYVKDGTFLILALSIPVLLADNGTFHNNVVFPTHSKMISLTEIFKKQGQNISLFVAAASPAV